MKSKRNIRIVHGFSDNEVAKIKHEQNIIMWRHAVRNLPADDRRHIEAKEKLAELGEAEYAGQNSPPVKGGGQVPE